MQKYLIRTSAGNYVIGTRSTRLNKGNDEEYPTFELEDGRVYSTHISNVQELKEEQQPEENQNG